MLEKILFGLAIAFGVIGFENLFRGCGEDVMVVNCHIATWMPFILGLLLTASLDKGRVRNWLRNRSGLDVFIYTLLLLTTVLPWVIYILFRIPVALFFLAMATSLFYLATVFVYIFLAYVRREKIQW